MSSAMLRQAYNAVRTYDENRSASTNRPRKSEAAGEELIGRELYFDRELQNMAVIARADDG
jgi:hypothetical protein